MNKLIVLLIIILAAVTRCIPHPPNFTPIIAIGLFGGAYIQNRSLAVLIPIAAMFLSDLFLGLHGTLYWVYSSMLLITSIGMLMMNRVTLKNCTIAVLSGSLLFFFITNFGVWFSSGYYSKNIAGLFTCYVMGLPFLGNTLIGSIFYSTVMFGGYEFLKRNMAKSVPEFIQK